MNYSDFLALLKQNTRDKLEDYKELCRFCLEYQTNGIDIGDSNNNNDDCSWKQRKDDILNNYINITKRYLLTSLEYPKFICSTCESQLSHYVRFVRKIEQNAENWEIFLKNVGDCNRLLNQVPVKEIEEIKIECCDRDYDNIAPDTDMVTSVVVHDALKVELSGERTVRMRKTRTLFVNQSTEYERTCKLCDEPTFLSLARFYKHQREHHPSEKSFICGICSSRFNNKSRLATHMQDRHTKWGKMHQCQFCAKLFYSDREVKGHEKLHLNARSNVCTLCGKGFNSKTTLNVHLKSKAHNADYKTVKVKKRPYVYNYNSKKAFRCQLCVPSTVFPTPEERTVHRNAMHRKFQCNICKNSFMAQESLDSHKLLHSDKPRPFVCTVCNATFNQSSHLTSHFKRKHTNEKKFDCSHCDRSFFESCELNAHARLVHKKQERVKCDKCAGDFATEKYLQKHIQQKHSTAASPYDCKICGKRNENGVKLDQHRLKHHKYTS